MPITGLVVAAACLAVARPAAAQGGRATPQEVFVAVLAGAYERPPLTTAATGTVEVTWTGTELRYQVHVDSIRDVTDAHIYIGRADGMTPPVADLFEGVRAGPVSGLLSRGTLRTDDVHGTTIAQLVQALRENAAYVTVHALSLQGGELRGQLRSQPAMTSRRSGADE